MPPVHKIVVVAAIEANDPADAVWAMIRGIVEGKVVASIEIQPRTRLARHTTPNSKAISETIGSRTPGWPNSSTGRTRASRGSTSPSPGPTGSGSMPSR